MRFRHGDGWNMCTSRGRGSSDSVPIGWTALNHISPPARSARSLEESRDDGQPLRALALAPKERPPDSREEGDGTVAEKWKWKERERESGWSGQRGSSALPQFTGFCAGQHITFLHLCFCLLSQNKISFKLFLCFAECKN